MQGRPVQQNAVPASVVKGFFFFVGAVAKKRSNQSVKTTAGYILDIFIVDVQEKTIKHRNSATKDFLRENYNLAMAPSQ